MLPAKQAAPAATLLFCLFGCATTALTDSIPASDIFVLEIREADGMVEVVGAPVAVTDRAGYDNQPLFTPDGLALLYTSIRDDQADTYRYDLTSRRTSAVTRTPESEYSPTPIPESDRFSVVRVEADGTQRLWSFAPDGSDPRLVLPDLAPVGYHAWVDAGTLALFVLGDPPTLQIASPGSGAGTTVAAGIGRAIQPVPGHRAVTFTQEVDGAWWLRSLDVESGDIVSLATLLEPDAYHAHTPDGATLAAHATRIYQLIEGRWVQVADLGPRGLDNLSRLAVSPDGTRLAVVVERRAVRR